jgi:hypothetical protein
LRRSTKRRRRWRGRGRMGGWLPTCGREGGKEGREGRRGRRRGWWCCWEGKREEERKKRTGISWWRKEGRRERV